MAAKSSTFDNDLLKLIFNNVAIAGIADAPASGTLTSMYVSLHTSTLDVSSVQTTNEITYTGYARVLVARNTTTAWTVSGSSVSPASAITFGASTGGTGGTVQYFAVGNAASTGGKIFYWGPVNPQIVVSSGVTPQLTTATAITEA